MARWIIRIENASGMKIEPAKYKVTARTKLEAVIKAMMKDKRSWDTKKEALELWKDKEYLADDDVYILGGDVVAIEVDKV